MKKNTELCIRDKNGYIVGWKVGYSDDELKQLLERHKDEGWHTIDSKSLLGLISVGFDHVCEVILHCDDEKVCNDFKNDMALWTTDEPLDIATSW